MRRNPVDKLPVVRLSLVALVQRLGLLRRRRSALPGLPIMLPSECAGNGFNEWKEGGNRWRPRRRWRLGRFVLIAHSVLFFRRQCDWGATNTELRHVAGWLKAPHY